MEAIKPAGIGALMALMEERKKKLAAEGLFDEAGKQLLPWLPEVIGVVTSPTGAGIRDILHPLEDRFPRRVLVWPGKGQGEGSARQGAAAEPRVHALPAAGELLAIPRQRLDHLGSALPRGLKANTHAHHRRFAQISAGLTLRVLRGQVSQARQRLTVSGERMRLSARALLRNRRDRFAGLEIRLKASKLSNAQAQRTKIAPERERTQRLAERARRALVTAMQRLEARLAPSH